MDKKRVIVADDEGLIAMDVAEMLNEAGYEVVGIAGNGAEALELGVKLRPDIFVMDIKMPVMDGLAAAKQIAAKGLGPVVILTAFAESGLMQEAGESGVYGYILKPVEEMALRAGMTIALNRYREQEELKASKKQAEQELAARKVVEKAKGLLMSRYGWSEDTAFAKLRDLAMKKGWKMEKVAAKVIDEIESKEKIKMSKKS